MFMKAKGYSIAIYLLSRIYLIAAETGGSTQTASANTNGINGKFHCNFPTNFNKFIEID